MKRENAYILSLDEASKQNLGVAGLGGVVTNPRGTKMFYYGWSLGLASSNQAKAFSLLKGIIFF